MNAKQMEAMKTATIELKKAAKESDLEKAEELHEDIAEAMELQREFNDLLAEPLIDYDDEELEQQLRELDDEVMDDGLIYGNMNKQAIHKLRAQIIVLEKKKDSFRKTSITISKAAQQCLKNKNRNGALAKLKLKKQVEKRIETLDNQMFNLEVQCMALEEAIMNAKQLEAMQAASKAMKNAVKEEDLENAEDIQEAIQEGMDLGQELNDLLNQPLVDCGDDDELLAELDDIMDDGLLYNNNKQKVQPKIEMKEDPFQEEEEEEEEEEESDEDVKEIKKLEMEMNMNSRPVIDNKQVQQKVKFEMKEDPVEDEQEEEEESDDEDVKEIKKLEMEMNMNSRPVIDVQIVETSSPKMMIATC
eukprot:CAMPEP_0201594800 /NCGR_PEP_ID=MMETSP0190_2-20130828/191999_1 /ASSEMBLY_ACC=CAM_ASM_000263 /TAXON_ID=37353 /ORGANISM="Rosalina sp." /LENGTH=359 /DNA_ID=CAMNT_0048054545 /DNA_START=427 /DNA_END=1507 /DNA_ORIENTATION=-